MKKTILILTALILVAALVSCGDYTPNTAADENGIVHTEFYLTDYTPERVKQCFDEVVLGSEYSEGEGDPSLVQKWSDDITYSVEGSFDQNDLDIIAEFFQTFKGAPGFPDATYSKNDPNAALKIVFLSESEFMEETNQFNADGYATYYFSAKTNVIKNGLVLYNDEMNPEYRRAVLLEELYNVMGAANDTVLRDDSIVYQFHTVAENFSDMDILIMRLLYLPNIKCGMTKDEVNSVIDKLYY